MSKYVLYSVAKALPVQSGVQQNIIAVSKSVLYSVAKAPPVQSGVQQYIIAVSKSVLYSVAKATRAERRAAVYYRCEQVCVIQCS